MKRVAIALAVTAGAAAAVVPVAVLSAAGGTEAGAPAVTAKQGLCIDLSPLNMASICIGRVL